MSENYEVERFRHTKPSYENGIVSSEKSESGIRVKVLSHALKHGLSEEDVVKGWLNPLESRRRHGTDDPVAWIALVALSDGKPAEMIAFQDERGTWCVFHAMTPPTKKFIKELREER